MKIGKLFSSFLIFALLLALLPGQIQQVSAISTDIVISQVYGGGGNSGAPYTNDFIELFNRGMTTVNITGWSVQYASATGTGNFGGNAVTVINGSLAPGQYYLVQLAGGTNGVALPSPDAIGTVNMSGSSGKVIVSNQSAGLACNGGSTPCSSGDLAAIVDLVGYGTANFYEGSPAPGLSNSTADFRTGDGCTDSDNNSVDFTAGTPNPRNTSSPLNPCSGGPTGQSFPLSEVFDDCTLAGWEIISVDTDDSHTWGCNAQYSNIDANGYGNTAPANEWLITPALNLDAQENDTLTFRNYTNYTDINYPQLHVLYSTDYAGGGNPTSATWTELSGINFSPGGSGSWVDSGEIDLSGISGTNVYFAFQYVSSGTGSGSAANWRLDSINFFEKVVIPVIPLPLSEGFDDCTLTNWEIVSVDADTSHTWSCNSTYSNIDVNGFGDSAPANDWLITPPLDMDAQEHDTLTFRNYTKYTDVDYPQLHVLYSTDYHGGGDPTSATWTELTGINFSPANSGSWVDSGPIDLSGIDGTKVYFAFQYVSSGTGSGSAANWRLDSIEFFEKIPIGEVQGSVGDSDSGTSHSSPYVGAEVAVQGVVYEKTQEYRSSGGAYYGLFIQNTAAEADDDPNSSDGIFVFLYTYPTLPVIHGGGYYEPQIGDELILIGTVEERFGNTRLNFVDLLEVVRTGVVLDDEIPAFEVNPPSSITDDTTYDDIQDAYRYWERHEGMRGQIPAGSIVLNGRDVFASTFDSEVWVARPDSLIAQRTEPYERRSFRDVHPLDDISTLGFDNDNPYRILMGTFGIKAAEDDTTALLSPARTFDTLAQEATGGVYYNFGKYSIQVDEQIQLSGVDPSLNNPPAAPDREFEYSIVDFNVENLYDFVDDPFDGCDFQGNSGCPGVNPPFDYAPSSDSIYQARLGEIAEQIISNLHSPDIILAQEAEDQDICTVTGGVYTCGTINNADGKPDTLRHCKPRWTDL